LSQQQVPSKLILLGLELLPVVEEVARETFEIAHGVRGEKCNWTKVYLITTTSDNCEAKEKCFIDFKPKEKYFIEFKPKE